MLINEASKKARIAREFGLSPCQVQAYHQLVNTPVCALPSGLRHDIKIAVKLCGTDGKAAVIAKYVKG